MMDAGHEPKLSIPSAAGVTSTPSLFVFPWPAHNDNGNDRSTARQGGVRKEAALLVAPREGAVRLVRAVVYVGK